jgi:hypothetical protein
MEPDPWSALPHYWLSVGLPGFKWESTFQGYKLAEMPPVPIELDDDLAWLRAHGTPRPGNGLDQRDEFVRPLPAAIVNDLAEQAGILLPVSFTRFMRSPELQPRVRSCTACYLDPGQRVVETIGSIPGHLVHFLSDSQSCAHWYIHLLHNGSSAVLESPDLYCYEVENSGWMENPACRLERVDLSDVEMHFCAPTFSEFLFRFWIENEIWYAVHDEESKRPLNDLETVYLGNSAASSST